MIYVDCLICSVKQRLQIYLKHEVTAFARIVNYNIINKLCQQNFKAEGKPLRPFISSLNFLAEIEDFSGEFRLIRGDGKYEFRISGFGKF